MRFACAVLFLASCSGEPPAGPADAAESPEVDADHQVDMAHRSPGHEGGRDQRTTSRRPLPDDYLLSLSTTISPDTPIQFLCKSVLVRALDGTATVDLELHALHAKARTQVGKKFSASGIDVAQDGTFSVDFGQVMIAGEANPISGSDMTLIMKFNGAVLSADRYCGDVVGRILMPIMSDLKGSRWGAVRVANGTIGDALPLPDWSCGPAADGGTVVDGGPSTD